MLCKINPHIVRVWSVDPRRSNRQIASGEWIVIRPDPTEVDTKYVRYTFIEPNFRSQFMETVAGVGGSLMRARPRAVAQIEVCLPPLDEQRRIVARLDALLARSKRARAELAGVPGLLERQKQAVINAGTSSFLPGHEANEASWKRVTFEELLAKKEGAIRRGPFGSTIKKDFFVPQGYKVYEQKNAIRSDATIGNYFIDEVKFKELEGFSVRSGDFIVSCAGTIGKIYQLPASAQGGVINQALMRIRTDKSLVDDNFFVQLFRSTAFQSEVLESTQGSAMQNLAAVKVIRQIPVWLPSLAEQHEIVRRIESAFARIERAAAEAERAALLLDRLEQATLARAFRGAL